MTPTSTLAARALAACAQRRRLAALCLCLAAAAVVSAALRAAPRASSPSRQQQQQFALVVGVKGYPHFPDDAKLKYADADAESFAQFIKKPEGGGFPEGNVRLLTNERATRANIYAGIEWLGRNATAESRVYFFFAGHGVVNMAGRAYFMPYEGDPSNLSGTGIRADSLLDEFGDNVRAKHMVFFIDACHAGAALKDGALARDGSNITADLAKAWREEFTRPETTRMGFFSAQPLERSWEDPELRHGLFTYYLLEGMKGGADTGDGKVAAGELRRYVEERVEARSLAKFKRQTPIASPNFDQSLTLAFVPARPTTPPPPPASCGAASDGRNLVISVVDEAGRGVSTARVLLVFSDGTYLRVFSDASGRACAAGLKQSTVAAYAVHTKFTVFHKASHDARTDLTITLKSRPATGSAFCGGGWCEIPGWQARFNPHFDNLGRTYFYMDNVAVNGKMATPFDFRLNEPLQIEDNGGRRMQLTFVAAAPGFFLYEITTPP